MVSFFVRAALALFVAVLSSSDIALAQVVPAASPSTRPPQSQPAPDPTSSPLSITVPSTAAKRLTFRATVRAFDFDRQNASNSPQGGAQTTPNQTSFNIGVGLHADYHVSSTWSIGGTYFYANPFGNCVTAVSHLTPPCGKVKPPSQNPDDTIPGFELSTLYEAFVSFKDPQFYAKLGNQTIVTPWATTADTRIKPAAFQGIDTLYTPNKSWAFQLSDMIRFESRTSSAFDKVTLLTGFPAGAPGVGSNIYVPGGTYIPTEGFLYARVGYVNQSGTNWTANANYYAFSDIANALWLDARDPLPGKMHPFVAAHFGSEKSAGASVIGKIDSTLFGLQAGANLARNVILTAGLDTVPIKTDTIVLPSGYSCASNHTIKGTANSANGVSLPYFLPTNGTGQCSPATPGKTNIYYGGWASPYTDSYTADPLYTTSLTQGMVERRSPGTAVKITGTFISSDRRFITYISRAFYSYNNPAYAQGTYETDFDAQYFLSKLPKQGLYHGLMLRYRYGVRTQSGDANIGGLPLFKNNRFQTEYDF